MKRRTNRRRVPIAERLKGLAAILRSGARYVAPLVLLAAIAVIVPIAVFGGYLHVVSTPYFSLDEIEVDGLKNLSAEQVLEQAQVEEGANAFDVDPDAVRLRLEAMPWIREAHVTKRLPRTLEITIEERVAAAVLVDHDVYTLLDERGEPFKQLDDDDLVDDLLELPLITGLSRPQAEATAGQELVIEALEVVQLARERQLPALAEVHVDPVMGLSIVPASTGIEVRLGRGRYADRLERLRAVFAALEREGRDVDYILVDGEENVNRVTVGSRAMERTDDP